MEYPKLLQALMSGQDIEFDIMETFMRALMSGELLPEQIAGFLVALRIKGETVEEIAAAAKVMREFATAVKVNDNKALVDTCGTGGDGAKTFNISTCSALVASAAGAKIAKHGNRSVTSKSGSADVLEAAGVGLQLTADQVARSIDTLGVGFLFAPAHHGAMKHAVGVRKALGVRTLFNLLGPLTNPAGARRQIIGVYDKAWLRPFAQVLKRLGSEHVLIVHGSDGLDEVTLSGPTWVAELKLGEITEYQITPKEIGVEAGELVTLAVDSASQSLALIESVLANQAGPALEIVAANAGAAIYLAGLVATWSEGVEMARDVISMGLAKQKLADLVDFTQMAGNAC